MFATLVLISTLCNISTTKGDSCDSAFEKTWVSTSLADFKKDGNSCLAVLDLYPDIETVDKDHIITRDCYIPDYTYEKTHKGKVKVEGMIHPENVFIYNVNELKVK